MMPNMVTAGEAEVQAQYCTLERMDLIAETTE